MDSTRLYCVNWVWLAFTGLDFGAFEFHLLISSLIESDRVLLLKTIFFSEFDWVRLGSTGFGWISLGFTFEPLNFT